VRAVRFACGKPAGEPGKNRLGRGVGWKEAKEMAGSRREVMRPAPGFALGCALLPGCAYAGAAV